MLEWNIWSLLGYNSNLTKICSDVGEKVQHPDKELDSETKLLVLETRDPVSETRDPVSETRDPVSETRDPVAEAQPETSKPIILAGSSFQDFLPNIRPNSTLSYNFENVHTTNLIKSWISSKYFGMEHNLKICVNDEILSPLESKFKIPITDRDLMVQALDNLILDGQELCHQMVQYNIIMSGSFPLQCLLRETYTNSDLNLYSNCPWQFYDFCNWLSSRYYCEAKWRDLNLPFVTSSRHYQINDQTSINLILLKTPDLDIYIQSQFDLSFCQTKFDGQNFEVQPLALRKVGMVSNLPMLGDLPLSGLIKRIKKYESRGYIIIDAEEYIESHTRLYSK